MQALFAGRKLPRCLFPLAEWASVYLVWRVSGSSCVGLRGMSLPRCRGGSLPPLCSGVAEWSWFVVFCSVGRSLPGSAGLRPGAHFGVPAHRPGCPRRGALSGWSTRPPPVQRATCRLCTAYWSTGGPLVTRKSQWNSVSGAHVPSKPTGKGGAVTAVPAAPRRTFRGRPIGYAGSDGERTTSRCQQPWRLGIRITES